MPKKAPPREAKVLSEKDKKIIDNFLLKKAITSKNCYAFREAQWLLNFYGIGFKKSVNLINKYYGADFNYGSYKMYVQRNKDDNVLLRIRCLYTYDDIDNPE